MASLEPITGVLRLNNDWSSKFGMMSKSEQDAFYDNLHMDLLTAVPIESDSLTTAKKSRRQQVSGQQYYLLSFTIHSSKQRNSVEIKEDIDMLIRNKLVSSMSAFNTTRALDENYGFVPIRM